MKKIIAIIAVLLIAAVLMGGCAQQAEPKKLQSAPRTEEPMTEEIEGPPEGEAEPKTPEIQKVDDDIAEAPVEEPVEEPGEPSAPPTDIPVSLEDLDALNSEIEGMEFEDLEGLSE